MFYIYFKTKQEETFRKREITLKGNRIKCCTKQFNNKRTEKNNERNAQKNEPS